MRLYLFLVTLLSASSLSAAQFSIGSPGANSQIQRGAQFLVSWGGLSGNASTVTIDLMQGSASALLLKEILASNVPAASGRTTVTVSNAIPSATNYFIRVRGNDIPSSVATQGPIAVFTSVASSASISSAAPSISASSVASNSSTSASSSLASTSTSTSSASTTSSSSATNSKTSSMPRETSPSDSDSNTGNDSILSSGAIAGIAIGGVAGIGVIAAILMCIRRSSRDDGDRMETSSEIFSSPPAYRNENKNMAVMPPPVLKRDEYSTPQRGQQAQGNYYSTGYDDGYYDSAPDAYQQQYPPGHAVNYDTHPYNNYGYHPAAVYMPALASPGAQQQYHGYGGNQNGNWDTQQQYPEPAYYNSTSPHPQPRSDPPHSPTSAHH